MISKGDRRGGRLRDLQFQISKKFTSQGQARELGKVGGVQEEKG